MISEKQTAYGTAFLEQVSKDLKAEFPEMSGFSVRNLKYTRQFYQFYTKSNRQQVVADLTIEIEKEFIKIPWGHNILIFTKCESQSKALFYLKETIENNWSRDVLELQIKSDLFKRQGNAISNFGTLIFSKETNL